MTPRLLAIAGLVRPGAAVVDVGSDHGYVPIYLLKTGIAKRALATDVNEGPLERSRENIARFGFGDAIGTQKANGMQDVDITSYDTVIIAGMGGMLIAEILQNAPELDGKKLILQPMTATAELRQYLTENGFFILCEHMVQEGEKLYVILEAEKGEIDPYSRAELLVGRTSKSDPLYPLLLKKTTEKLHKRLNGLLKGKTPEKDEIERIKALLEELES